MLQTVGTITLISTIPTVIFFGLRRGAINNQQSLFAFALFLLLTEIVLYVTAQCGIRNHVIGNVSTLLYYLFSVTLVLGIWQRNKGNSAAIKILKYALLLIITIGWLFENFVFADISYYNPFVSTIASFILVIITIYLINVILFIKSGNIIKDSDGLILIGMLIRSFFVGLLMLFMNYRMKYSNDFYEKILLLVNIALIISNICFTLSVLCLPKKKKYTWPF